MSSYFEADRDLGMESPTQGSALVLNPTVATHVPDCPPFSLLPRVCRLKKADNTSLMPRFELPFRSEKIGLGGWHAG